jgi:hypothetical protein
MALELGVYSFGNTPAGGSTAQAIRDVVEAVHVATPGAGAVVVLF